MVIEIDPVETFQGESSEESLEVSAAMLDVICVSADVEGDVFSEQRKRVGAENYAVAGDGKSCLRGSENE